MERMPLPSFVALLLTFSGAAVQAAEPERWTFSPEFECAFDHGEAPCVEAPALESKPAPHRQHHHQQHGGSAMLAKPPLPPVVRESN